MIERASHACWPARAKALAKLIPEAGISAADLKALAARKGHSENLTINVLAYGEGKYFRHVRGVWVRS